MGIVKFQPANLVEDLGPASPVPVPVQLPASMIRCKSFAGTDDVTETGVWECTPGVWRRQITQSEFCYFTAGRCTFTPDGGVAIEISEGDAVFFPANTLGVWNVQSLLRKFYVVF